MERESTGFTLEGLMHALGKTLNWSRGWGPQAALHGIRWGGGRIFYQARCPGKEQLNGR